MNNPMTCPQCDHPRETEWHFCPRCACPLAPMPGPAWPALGSLVACTDADIQEMLKRIARADLLQALADPAWASLKLKVLANLPKGAVRLLEDEWGYLRPDEEATAQAQRMIQHIAYDLDEAGVIRLPQAGDVWVLLGDTDQTDAGLEAAVTALGVEGIHWVLSHVDKKTLTLCLFAARQNMRRAFFDEMSTRAVALMEEEMDFLGRVELKSIQSARTELRGLIETFHRGTP